MKAIQFDQLNPLDAPNQEMTGMRIARERWDSRFNSLFEDEEGSEESPSDEETGIGGSDITVFFVDNAQDQKIDLKFFPEKNKNYNYIAGDGDDEQKPGGKNSQQGYFPAPKNGLPAFPDAGKGAYNPKSGRWRWKLPNGDILEWDKKHGEVERYDKTGKKHKGSYDPKTGELKKHPVKGRVTPKFSECGPQMELHPKPPVVIQLVSKPEGFWEKLWNSIPWRYVLL